LLAPGSIRKDGLPDINFNLGLMKREINFKEAWEIGPNDLDCVLVFPEDKPVIPAEVNDPPVKELLKIKSRTTRRKLS